MTLDSPLDPEGSTRFTQPQSQVALFLTAHCDDAELWAGGTIRRYNTAGWRTVAAIMHHEPHRCAEARASANLLGLEVRFRVETAVIRTAITECLHELQPEVIFTHPECDPHFEHAEIFRATVEALTRSRMRKAFPLRWYAFDTYYRTRTPHAHPLLIDITPHFAEKRAALRCHRSQNPRELVRMAYLMNGLHGMRSRVRYAEAFYPFDLLGRSFRMRELP